MTDGLSMHERLLGRWLELVIPPAQPTNAAATFDQLVAAYGEDGRHYHDLRHVAALLDLAAGEAGALRDPRSVGLAIFFHDAVYDVSRKDNEAASAALAQMTMRALGFSLDEAIRVGRLIEATAHLGPSVPGDMADDPDLARLLDFDLAILAADAATYDAYAADVRREYACYPDAQFNAGRIKVLEAFLAAPRLFRVAVHHKAWDRAARSNLCRELARLKAR
ncbi:MAG: hypothetical protein ACK5JT_17205 [Hyphomicrobiaceae bacterium]